MLCMPAQSVDSYNIAVIAVVAAARADKAACLRVEWILEEHNVQVRAEHREALRVKVNSQLPGISR